MAKVEYIKDLYENEGMSLREIAKRTNHHFDTVRKYAYQTDWNQPDQQRTRQKEFITMKDYTSIVDEWLEQDEKEPRNQRHTATSVYNRLQKEHDYTGSYCSVKRYFNHKRAEMKKYGESYLPLSHPAGHAQVDFGDFKYYDDLGKAHKGHALIVSFPHSNNGWMQVFQAENQECLLTGLKKIFYHIGGVPKRLRCDNMTTAVAKVQKGTERIITDGFYRFMLHHRFEADFCNPAKANEKGNVENKVGYTRRNMLVPVPVITDFEEYNKELLIRCDADHERNHYLHGIPLKELWEEDKRVLLTLPKYEYDVFTYDSCTVTNDGFLLIDNNRYGLPPEYRGKIVQVKIFYDRIMAFYEDCFLKDFRRCYDKNNEDCDWKDYLPSLIKKPGAVEHTRFFNQMPKLWQEYLKSTKGQERKTALTLLMEIVRDGNEAFCDDALELAGEYGRLDADNIRQCYLLLTKPENCPQPLKLLSDLPLLNYKPDLSVYDKLTRGAS